MYSLSGADTGKVTISLVSKDDCLREGTLDTCSYSCPSTVCRFCHIYIKIVIGENRTSRWWDTDGFILEIQFVDNFSDKPVNNRVPTSRTIVKRICF